MSRDKRDYTIKVTKPANDYVVQLFEGNDHIGVSDELTFNKATDNMKKTAHYKLNFDIDDSSLANADKVRFAPVNDDVMWVSEDITQCPETECHKKHAFWVDKNVNGKKLTLINMDLKPERLRFRINLVKVSDPGARPFIFLDPIIGNGNNGSPESFVSAMLVTGALTGALVGIGAATLATSGFVAPTALVYGIVGAVAGMIVGLVLDRM